MKAARLFRPRPPVRPRHKAMGARYVFDFNTLLAAGASAFAAPGLFPGGPRRVSRDGRPQYVILKYIARGRFQRPGTGRML